MRRLPLIRIAICGPALLTFSSAPAILIAAQSVELGWRCDGFLFCL